MTQTQVNFQTYSRLFLELKKIQGKGKKKKRAEQIRNIARQMVKDSWSPCGIRLRLGHKEAAIAGQSEKSPNKEANIPTGHLRLDKGQEVELELDCWPEFRTAEIAQLLLAAERRQALEPTTLVEGTTELRLSISKPQEDKPTKDITIEEWRTRLETARPEQVPDICQTFQDSICPAHAGEESLIGFTLAIMSLANRLSQVNGQKVNFHAKEAALIWTTLLQKQREIDEVLDDQSGRVVQTAMKVANLCVNKDTPPEQWDIDSAVTIWQALLQQASVLHTLRNHEQSTKLEVLVKTMMQIANNCVDTTAAKNPHTDYSLKIWAALIEETNTISQYLREHRQVTRKTAMDIANKLIDTERKRPEERDTQTAIRIWSLLLEKCAISDPKFGQLLVSTIADIALKLLNQATPPDPEACFTLCHCLLKHQQVIDQLKKDNSEHIVRTIMNVAQRHPGVRPVFIATAVRVSSGTWIEQYLLADLYYADGQYDQVITQVDSGSLAHPALDCIKADALRKQGKYDQADDLCQDIVGKTREAAEHWLEVSNINARVCLGYVRLEQGRLSEAADIFLQLTEQRPQRALMGLAYVKQRQGDQQTALSLAKQVLDVDADNQKALALQRELKAT